MAQPRMRISATVLGAPDPPALGAFYARLLAWTVVENDPGWVRVKPPDGGPGLSFQLESDYVPPVWRQVPGAQQMMSHLDIGVDDLERGVAWALGAGARRADLPPQEHVRPILAPVVAPCRPR